MTRTRDNIERMFIGLCAASLTVNAWLISTKLEHIDSQLKDQGDKLGTVAEDVAATKAEVQMHTVSISYLQRLQDYTKHKDN